MSIKDKNDSIISVFIPLWEELLSGFKEYSFDNRELKFIIDADNNLTKLKFSKKLQREFIITLHGKKKEVDIGKKNEIFTFFSDGTILIKEGPSISLAMMQILITHTRNRLKEEKREKIKKNKEFISNTIKEMLIKNNFSLDEKKEQVKKTVWYKKGVYCVKISFNKKNNENNETNLYLFYDELVEMLNSSGLQTETYYEIK